MRLTTARRVLRDAYVTRFAARAPMSKQSMSLLICETLDVYYIELYG
jgi:hypothetical protein